MVLFSGVTSLNNIKAIYMLPKPVEHLFGIAFATPVWFLYITIHRYVCMYVLYTHYIAWNSGMGVCFFLAIFSAQPLNMTGNQ